MTGSASNSSHSRCVYPRPAGDSALYSAKCSESGSRNASRRDAVLARCVSGIDPNEPRLGLGEPELIEQPRRLERRGRDPLAERGDRLRRGAHPRLVVLGQEEGPEERTVHAIAERELARPHRRGELLAVAPAQLDVGPQQRMPRGDRRPSLARSGRPPAAPMTPDGVPMPSISSQRGQRLRRIADCSARSITSALIFSTTCEK